MSSDHNSPKKVGSTRPASTFQRMERMPPLLMMLYVGLAGITVLFVGLVGAYAITHFRTGAPSGLFALPRFFSLSTIVLLASSYVIAQASRIYAHDDLPTLRRCLGATLLLSCVFAGLQVLGWRELMAQGVFFDGMASGSFVYLLSALHVAHLLGGMVFFAGVVGAYALRRRRPRAHARVHSQPLPPAAVAHGHALLALHRRPLDCAVWGFSVSVLSPSL